MRYVIQYLVPLLMVVVVATLILRSRRGPNNDDGEPVMSTGAFVTVLIVGAVFTAAIVFATQNWIE